MLHNSLEPDRTDGKTVQYVLQIILLCILISLMVFFCRQTGYRSDIKQS